MAELVEAGLLDSADLTWNNNAYTWDSVPTAFTWDDNQTSGWYLTVTSNELNIQDAFSKATTSRRVFVESLNITDSIYRSFSKTFIENLNITDAYVQNSTSVVFDISLRSASNYNINDVRTLARQAQIAGYEQGVEFLPGDYDFREAIVGLVLTNNTDSKIGFKEIDMYTDTPDIVDRGNINITNSGSNYDPNDGFTTVTLNKPYHFVPNVTAAVVSGNVLSDYIFDPNGFTNTHFRVKIVSKSDYTTPTTGTLLWKAIGY